jgi:ketosteroid isomerase-like protein
MTSTTDNKRLTQEIFSELSEGNLAPLLEAMADDVEWTWMGTMRWSKTFKGKESVVDELFSAVKSSLASPFKVVPHCLVAEGDYVVVECRGQNATPDGKPYNNRYCWVFRFEGGKLREVREYMDTELVTATFRAGGES